MLTNMTRNSSLLLIGITLLALGLRLHRLDAQSLWHDEAASWRCTQASWPTLVETVVAGECTPPLYFTLLKIWTALMGDSAVAMRLLSVLLGTLTVPLLGWFVGRLSGPGPACLTSGASYSLSPKRKRGMSLACASGPGPGYFAALFLAISPFHIEFSQDARPYALLPFLILAATAVLSWAFENGTTAEWEKAGTLSHSPLFPFSLYAVLALLAWYRNYFYAFLPFLILAATSAFFWVLEKLKQSSGPGQGDNVAKENGDAAPSRLLPFSLYAIVALLACYTHYFTAFYLAGHGVFVALVCWKERRLRPMRNWLLCMAVVGVCFLPWLPYMLRTNLQSVQWLQDYLGQWTPLMQLWFTLKCLVFGGTYPLPFGNEYPDAALVLTPLVAWLGFRRDKFEIRNPKSAMQVRDAFAYSLIGVMTVLPLLVAWIFSQFRPCLMGRYVIPTVPFAMALFALAIWRVRWFVPRVLLASSVVVYLLMCLQGQLANPTHADLRQVAAHISDEMQPGDGLIMEPWHESLVLSYFLGQRMLPIVNKHGWPAELDEATLSARLAPYKRVWYVRVDAKPSPLEQYLDRYPQASVDQAFFRVPIVKLYVVQH
jgi:uncharacterized membrane protein